MSDDALTFRRIHRSLYRPNLFQGAEREPMLTVRLLAGMVVMASMSLVGLIVGAALWIVGTAALNLMAKDDPDACKVYVRSVKYPAYIPARARAVSKT